MTPLFPRNEAIKSEWWAHGNEQSKLTGQLFLDEKNGGHVKVTGTRSALFELFLRKPKALAGTISGRYAYTATLLNPVFTRWPAAPGEQEATGELITNEIVISANITNDLEKLIARYQFSSPALAEFCDSTGFNLTATVDNTGVQNVTVKYERPKRSPCTLRDGSTVCISSWYDGPLASFRSKSIAASEVDWIQVELKNPISVKDLHRELTIWQSFIGLGTRSPPYLDQVRFGTPAMAAGEYACEILIPGRRGGPTSAPRHISELLFTTAKLGATLQQRLIAWHSVFAKIELAVVLFAGQYFQTDAFFHARLLANLQALELLHRELFNGSRFPDKATKKRTLAALRGAIPADLDPSLSSYLGEQIGYLGTLTLLDRLNHLFKTYPRTLTPLFPDGAADMKLLKDVRNFLTHFGTSKQLDKDFLMSRRMVVLYEKSRLFVEVCLLGATGMTDDELYSLFGNFEQYNGWRHEDHK